MYSYGYSGYMPPQQYDRMQARLNQMEQQYNAQQNPYMNNTQYGQMPVQQIIKGRPVSSMEEAKASMIDLDGSLFVFPDLANKMIHTKQIMMDGTAEFKTYVLNEAPVKQNEQQPQQNNLFVLRSEFESYQKQIQHKLEEMEGFNDGNGTNVTNNGTANVK